MDRERNRFRSVVGVDLVLGGLGEFKADDDVLRERDLEAWELAVVAGENVGEVLREVSLSGDLMV